MRKFFKNFPAKFKPYLPPTLATSLLLLLFVTYQNCQIQDPSLLKPGMNPSSFTNAKLQYTTQTIRVIQSYLAAYPCQRREAVFFSLQAGYEPNKLSGYPVAGIYTGSVGKSYIGVSASNDLMIITKMMRNNDVDSYNIETLFCATSPTAPSAFASREISDLKIPNGITLTDTNLSPLGIVTANLSQFTVEPFSYFELQNMSVTFSEGLKVTRPTSQAPPPTPAVSTPAPMVTVKPTATPAPKPTAYVYQPTPTATPIPTVKPTSNPTPAPTPIITAVPTTPPSSGAPAGTVFNVKNYGAKGDGVTNDSQAIQNALNAATSGSIVYVPPGVYMINARHEGRVGVLVKSNTTLYIDPKATLRAIPNNWESYVIVKVWRENNIVITGGGTIEGERAFHTGSGGEWGMCVSISEAQNITLKNVTVKNCWGDGVYVNDKSKNITVDNIVADNNRRQGMSIIEVDGMVVRNSVFKNTNGTEPAAGIDIEPNEYNTVDHVQILNNTFSGNDGGAFQSGVPGSHTGISFVRNILFEGNTAFNNRQIAIQCSNSVSTTIRNNTVRDNPGIGILLRNNANGFIISGNTVTNNTEEGIFFYYNSGTVVSGNTVSENKAGIRYDSPATITNNIVKSNRQHGIYTTSGASGVMSGNINQGNGLTP